MAYQSCEISQTGALMEENEYLWDLCSRSLLAPIVSANQEDTGTNAGDRHVPTIIAISLNFLALIHVVQFVVLPTTVQPRMARLWCTKNHTSWTKTRFAIAWAGNQMIPLCVYQSITQLTLPLLLGEKKSNYWELYYQNIQIIKKNQELLNMYIVLLQWKKKTPEFAVSDFLI